MTDHDRALRPLEEAEHAVERLRAYENEAELAESLGTVWRAVERSLRYLLRMDAGAPDDVRLAALSPQELPIARLVAELRKRERISLALAGRIHELERVVAVAAKGVVQARDADLGVDVAERLRAEIETPPTAAIEVTEAAPLTSEPPAPATRRRFGGQARLIAALVAVGIVVILIVRQIAAPSDFERGVSAFRQGRLGLAEQHFRAAIESNDEDVTARLYLARVFRREGRFEEASTALRTAADRAPDDADVRRELGHLFMDLERPELAVKQYRRAQELAPEDRLNWLGLIRSLRAADDPEADDVLRRAPADVRAALDSAAA